MDRKGNSNLVSFAFRFARLRRRRFVKLQPHTAGNYAPSLSETVPPLKFHLGVLPPVTRRINSVPQVSHFFPPAMFLAFRRVAVVLYGTRPFGESLPRQSSPSLSVVDPADAITIRMYTPISPSKRASAKELGPNRCRITGSRETLKLARKIYAKKDEMESNVPICTPTCI